MGRGPRAAGRGPWAAGPRAVGRGPPGRGPAFSKTRKLSGISPRSKNVTGVGGGSGERLAVLRLQGTIILSIFFA